MRNRFLDRLGKDVILIAEGYVLELERRGYIKAGPFVPEVVLDYPNALFELHMEFLRAGSDVMEALTYYASSSKLRDVGREKELEKLNVTAIRLAKKAAKDGSALVAGNICNTWAYDPARAKETGKVVKAMFREQIALAAQEGVDFIISETNDFLGEALIGLEVIKEFHLPAMVNLASFQEKTRDGYAYDEACKILSREGADVVGLNCSRGPATMLPLIRKIRKAVSGHIAALPVPYRTNRRAPDFQKLKKDGKQAFPIEMEQFLLTRYEMAQFVRKARDIGVSVIGICCGAGPHHVRAMAEALGRFPPASKYSPVMELHPMVGKREKRHST